VPRLIHNSTDSARFSLTYPKAVSGGRGRSPSCKTSTCTIFPSIPDLGAMSSSGRCCPRGERSFLSRRRGCGPEVPREEGHEDDHGHELYSGLWPLAQRIEQSRKVTKTSHILLVGTSHNGTAHPADNRSQADPHADASPLARVNSDMSTRL
jgi:hypothetical protein